MATLVRHLRDALVRAFEDDALNTAKAAAYSGILMIFPGLVVLTTVLAVIPEGNSLLDEVRAAAEQFLPADTMSLLQSYFQSQRVYSVQVILSATALTAFAALGVMLSLMEGFRRAYRIPAGTWGFWGKRLRALMLGPIALVPLSVATLLLVFGHPIEQWMINNSDHELRTAVLVLWRLARWTLAVATSVAVMGTIYHFGTQRKEHWAWVGPGALAATLFWFPVTLAFGWYVTRVADYTMIYGSLGTGIATLGWLYLTAFSILLGAELNGVLYRERQSRLATGQAD